MKRMKGEWVSGCFSWVYLACPYSSLTLIEVEHHVIQRGRLTCVRCCSLLLHTPLPTLASPVYLPLTCVADLLTLPTITKHRNEYSLYLCFSLLSLLSLPCVYPAPSILFSFPISFLLFPAPLSSTPVPAPAPVPICSFTIVTT